jgi:hypothetical protein
MSTKTLLFLIVAMLMVVQTLTKGDSSEVSHGNKNLIQTGISAEEEDGEEDGEDMEEDGDVAMEAMEDGEEDGGSTIPKSDPYEDCNIHNCQRDGS